ncbi:LolA family protein [Streptomyces sp. NRRL S-118]|uniref:LolA family protein n=1 Tax=Streptomyces sp. NRRL S-118 TaxID=1463881 RepID=UPI0004C6CA98|nr:sigma-E factor regulatory protein RseB domain-containing protein [Streptomyces sp. NRRL S-118]
MAPNDSAGRRRTARYAVPVAVAGVAAATIGLVPALAASGDPELPQITAQQLVEKIAASDVQQLSGTVKVTTDLGLPSFAGLEGLVGAAGGGGEGGDDPAVGKLMELASGTHTLRVAADGPGKQRLDFVDDAAEYSLIRNGEDVWAYDGASREAVHSTEKNADGKGSGSGHEPEFQATPQGLAEEALKAVDDTTSVTVDGTARIAGRDAYQLLIKPKQSGSTIGSIKVAVDAEKGVPLKFTLMPSGGGKAAIDAGFTKVDFGAPAASTFAPPKDAKVTEEPQAPEELPEGLAKDLPKDMPKDLGKDLSKDLPEDFAGPNVIGEGWTAVAQLSAPGGESGEGVPAEADRFLDVLGDKVSGKFGSGTIFKTRLVNALLTDDGTLYAGAVSPERLVEVADGAK